MNKPKIGLTQICDRSERDIGRFNDLDKFPKLKTDTYDFLSSYYSGGYKTSVKSLGGDFSTNNA